MNMQKWKAPGRPNHEITQPFNSGIVNIFTIKDTARPGYRPIAELTPLLSLRYQERKLGIQRYYEGRQNQIEIERVIRVPQSNTRITNQDIAVTEDGSEYRIDLVQAVEDIYPPCWDLTLARIEQEP